MKTRACAHLPNSSRHQRRACQPAAAAAAEGQVCTVLLAKSDDYLSAKDNRLQHPPPAPPDKRRDYRGTQLKPPPREICADCGGRSQRLPRYRAPNEKEGGRLTLSTARRLAPARQIVLVCAVPPTANYLLDPPPPPPPLPSNHQMQINKSGGIILAITRREMTKIKRHRHS